MSNECSYRWQGSPSGTKCQFGTINLKLINNALKERGYESLERILQQPSLQCECNKWLKKNIVYVKGLPLVWVLGVENDSLKISKILNVDRDPDDLLKLNIIRSFYWPLSEVNNEENNKK